MMDEFLTAKGDFFLKVIDVKTGVCLEEYSGKNLVVTLGQGNIAKFLGGSTSGKSISKIGVGTNGTAPALTDTALTAMFSKAINSVSYPEVNTVRFDWEILSGEANGLSIKEFGLLNADNVLIARKIRSEIIKTSAISLTGSWKLSINS